MSDPVVPAPARIRAGSSTPVSVAHGSVLLFASSIARAVGGATVAVLYQRRTEAV